MTARFWTAIAGLVRLAAVALAAAVLEPGLSRAEDLSGLPDASLCSVVLVADRSALDQGPQWAAHRKEAARRNLNLTACRLALGFPAEVSATRDNRTVCDGALDRDRFAWATTPQSAGDRMEAGRRNLTVDDCRKALGLAGNAGTTFARLEDRVICEGALDESREIWETMPAWQRHRVEAARRGFDISACREKLGLPATPADALRRASDKSLCSIILNASRTGFDMSPTWAPSRAEAERRKLDLAGCRVALGFPAEPGPAERAVNLGEIEKDNCKAALDSTSVAFSNGPQARAARAQLEKAGRTARDCRKLLDIQFWPLTAMLVAVEQDKKISVRLFAVTELRCHALTARLDRAIGRGKALRETLASDAETSGFTVMQHQQVAATSWFLNLAFGMNGSTPEAAGETEGRIRAVACITAAQVTYSRMDARPADREYSARIERVNASEVSLKGELGLWQFPELVSELLVSEPPRRLVINSNGGRALFALMLAAVLDEADVELVVRKGAECQSSCAVLAALVHGRAVVSRKARVGVHRAYDIKNGKPTREGLEEGERILAQALVDAGVNHAFIDRMNSELSITRTAPVRERDAVRFGLGWRWTD
jgi:hypothetical protein